MNLCLSRSQSIQLIVLMKHFRCLYYWRNYQNVLIPSESTTANVDLHNFLLKLNNVNKFSTTNVLSKSKNRYKEKKTVVCVDTQEIAEIVKVDHMMSQFEQALENYKQDMIKNLSLRTRVGSIEELTIKFNDDEYTLQEVVNISRKSNMIVLDVSEFPQMIQNILEALMKSGMNLNPQKEGNTIYIPLAKVTKEHRENLVKGAKQYLVKCKDRIRDIRNEHIKALKKKDKVPADLAFRTESYIHALHKEYVDKAIELLKIKEKELLGES